MHTRLEIRAVLGAVPSLRPWDPNQEATSQNRSLRGMCRPKGACPRLWVDISGDSACTTGHGQATGCPKTAKKAEVEPWGATSYLAISGGSCCPKNQVPTSWNARGQLA